MPAGNRGPDRVGADPALEPVAVLTYRWSPVRRSRARIG